jgi:hypothetical protein
MPNSNISLREGEALTSEQGIAVLHTLVSTGQITITPFMSKQGNPGWSFQHRPVPVDGMAGVSIRMSGFLTVTKKDKAQRGPVTLAFAKVAETSVQRKARRAKHTL